MFGLNAIGFLRSPIIGDDRNADSSGNGEAPPPVTLSLCRSERKSGAALAVALGFVAPPVVVVLEVVSARGTTWTVALGGCGPMAVVRGGGEATDGVLLTRRSAATCAAAAAAAATTATTTPPSNGRGLPKPTTTSEMSIGKGELPGGHNVHAACAAFAVYS